MNKKKVQNNKDEDRVDFSRWYPQEYKEKGDEFVEHTKLIVKSFNSFLDSTRILFKDVPLERDICSLKGAEITELIKHREKWELLTDAIDAIESRVKKITNDLLFCFEGNESGEEIHKFNMIHVPGYEDADFYDYFFLGTEVVPDILAISLFDLQECFMLLASCSVTAWKTREDIVAIINHKPPKMEDRSNEELKPFWDIVFNFKERLENLENGQEEIKRKIVVHDDRSIRKLAKIEDKVDKKNRADKRQSLTQEECAELLYKKKVYYCKKKENYLVRVGITATVPRPPKDAKHVERTIQRWDQYLVSGGEKGAEPPKGYSREISKIEFERWAETLELMKYEKWEKRQPQIRNIYGPAIDTPEDEEYLEGDEEDQESRAEEDMVDRLARTSKRY